MDRILMIVTASEMLFINLFMIHQCIKRKYSLVTTIVCMGLCSSVLFVVSYLISRQFPGFGGGNGLFVFSGFLFLIPILVLYRAPIVRILTIGSFSWTYTFMVFVFSVRIAYVGTIPGLGIHGTVLLLQTILYLVTFLPFYRLLKSRFIVVLESNRKKEVRTFMWMTMSWFWTVFILNLSFWYHDIGLFQILTMITLVVGFLSCFWFIFSQVNSNKTIADLENIVHRDELTQLRTRAILSKDAEDFISREMPFSLIFFDLDSFKSINDRYGHLIGDAYLAFFAHEVKTRLGNRGGFYRISGDEFVCIIPMEETRGFLRSLATMPEVLPDTKVRFLGFSYGIATFPQNGCTIESLLDYADGQMYEMKQEYYKTSQPTL